MTFSLMAENQAAMDCYQKLRSEDKAKYSEGLRDASQLKIDDFDAQLLTQVKGIKSLISHADIEPEVMAYFLNRFTKLNKFSFPKRVLSKVELNQLLKNNNKTLNTLAIRIENLTENDIKEIAKLPLKSFIAHGKINNEKFQKFKLIKDKVLFDVKIHESIDFGVIPEKIKLIEDSKTLKSLYEGKKLTVPAIDFDKHIIVVYQKDSADYNRIGGFGIYYSKGEYHISYVSVTFRGGSEIVLSTYL